MTITSPNRASRAWRGRCGRRCRSMRAPPTKSRRPKARSAAETLPAAGCETGRQATMSTYTVHEPPLRANEDVPDPVRVGFVRDGVSFWAFLLSPLWMLRHRLWLVLVGYLILAAALQVGVYRIGASASVMFVVGFLLSLLVGFEAATLRRFTLGRRGWRNVGIVVGDDVEAAERRFFDAWVKGEARPPAPPPSPPPMLRRPPPASDVIGLFPEPGAPR